MADTAHPTRRPVAPAAMRLLGGRYRLEQVVGAGAMATVWRGRDAFLDRCVAIKVMSDPLAADPAYVERFVGEARTAAAISHRNLVQVYDYSADGDRPYLVMEYVDGGTLAERVLRGPLSPPALAQLARDLLSALDCVHGAGVLHRDVKPANVLLGSDGRARLTDFGMAGLEDDARLTRPDDVIGTLRYIAPEILSSGRPSRQSDLYALGVLLHETPLDGRLDPRLRSVVDDLMQPDPALRPADAGALLRRLGAPPRPARGDGGAVTGAAAPLPDPNAAPPRLVLAPQRDRRPPARSRKRIRAAAAGALATVVVLVVLVAATAGAGSGGRSGSPPPAATPAASGQPVVRRGLSLRQRLRILRDDVRAAAR